MSDTPIQGSITVDKYSHLPFDVQHIVRKLERENAALQKTVNNCNADWAEDHTQLQNLCIQAGISSYEVNGDSYGVPGIIELGEMLAKKVAALRETFAVQADRCRDLIEEIESENAALKQRIIDDNKAYGCELRDPSGTIWDYAAKLERENADQDRTLATIQDIVDSSYRSDRAKILAIKYASSQ